MKQKAKYIGKHKHRYDDGVDLMYEYRGREYMVCDEHNGYSESMAEKHRREQERIDNDIENESKPKKPFVYEDTAEYGFELFWQYVETGKWAEE